MQVLEKSKFARETGAAIHIPPNCTALLLSIGVDPKDFGGTLLEQIHNYTFSGHTKHKKEFSPVRHQWQAEWYLVHRVDLHNNLKQRLLKTPTPLHTGCTITSVDIDSDRPSVTLDDGRVFTCDLLLGADGLHSLLRTHIAPTHPAPKPVGKSCFRWLLPVDELRDHPATKETVGHPGVFIEWSADDRRFVAYPCSDSKVFNICGFLPTAEAGMYGDGWQAKGDKSLLAKAFSDFTPAVKHLIDSAGEDLKVWELFDMARLPSWVKGRAALLGDAAHPFQPYMGQGAAMAIEDALSLATLLPLGTKIGDIPARLGLYEQARMDRVEYVMTYTRLNGADENNLSVRRIPPEEMIRVMGVCFAHNEIESSRALLGEEARL
ncbi:FAD/NAD(P)-binding domain-containing protein [Aspergillus avenaceus]|uniref:FAD/NAD(P)-binding domain-containing protein n=1 Tax=Aspergillus avenaceus TaxID=36643 RepID=A0A5N6TWD0_ASPAV|nr:FAD/NAD(P)-binding domain-containing protein [Aspergillus avenaceus]